MATNPVPIKQQTPSQPAAPDIFQALRTEMDRLFDRVTSGWPSMRRMFDMQPPMLGGASRGMMAPAVDVSEDDGAYRITAELPGATEDEIEVNVSGNTLTIKGEKRQETERKDQSYYLSERSYGSFQRSFGLPEDVDRDNIQAGFSKGVLTLTLPKSAESKSAQKKIEVKPG